MFSQNAIKASQMGTFNGILVQLDPANMATLDRWIAGHPDPKTIKARGNASIDQASARRKR
jgi:hypothetical protein